MRQLTRMWTRVIDKKKKKVVRLWLAGGLAGWLMEGLVGVGSPTLHAKEHNYGGVWRW